jgi:hypothetical protein
MSTVAAHTKVNVEHDGIGALHQHALAVGDGPVDHVHRVGHERADPLSERTQARELRLAVVLEVCEALHLVAQVDAVPRSKALKVGEIMHAQAAAAGLGRVRGPDALARRAEAATAPLLLLQPVHRLVVVKHQVRAVRQKDPPLPLEPCPPHT